MILHSILYLTINKHKHKINAQTLIQSHSVKKVVKTLLFIYYMLTLVLYFYNTNNKITID